MITSTGCWRRVVCVLQLLMVVLLICLSTVTGNHRPAQPWPIIVDRFASCCDLIQNSISLESFHPDELQAELNHLGPCVQQLHEEQLDINSHYAKSTKPSHRIAMVTMSMKSFGEHHIPNIELFAPYQRLIVGAYSEHHQYQYFDFDSWKKSHTVDDDGYVEEESDVRWNKIMMLIEALHPVRGWARDVDAIVWIDSDAIVLDFGFAIEDVLAQYPKADIIASADIKLGLINTGFFIVRNTHWARNILQRWWDVADRSVVCDQDAFDQLYLRLLQEAEEERQEIEAKVKILSTDSINSHPPAWMYQTPSNQVLHLMGETALFRAGVFRKGYVSVCQARSGGFLSPQLSIHPENMIDLAKQIYKEETQLTFKTANETHSVDAIEALFKASYHYVDVLSYISSSQLRKKSLKQQYQNEVVRIREAVLKLTLHSVEVARSQITSLSNTISKYHNDTNPGLANQETEEEEDNTTPKTAKVDALFQELVYRRAQHFNDIVTMQKKAAEAGNALYWAVSNLEDRQNIANLVFDILTDLEKGVVEDSKFIPNHMRALMHQNLAMSLYEEAMKLQQEATSKNEQGAGAISKKVRSHLASALKHATSSVNIFDKYFRDTEEGSTMMEHLQSIQLQAGISCMTTKYVDAVGYWQEAIAKARKNTRGLKIGIHYERLAVVLYNAAVCFMDAQDQIQAKDYAEEAKSIVNHLINEKSQKLESAATANHQQVKELKELLKMIDEFLKQAEIIMEDSRNHLLHRRERQQAQEEQASVESSTNQAASATTVDVLPSIKRIQEENGNVRYVYEPNAESGETEDDYEWEECTDLEEGCEAYVVYDEVQNSKENVENVKPAESKPTTPAASTGKNDEKAHKSLSIPSESDLYEGLDEEEILELMEVRKRYAHVTGVQDFFGDLLDSEESKEPATSETPITLASCNCQQEIERLQDEVRSLQSENKALQEKLEKIKKAFDMN